MDKIIISISDPIKCPQRLQNESQSNYYALKSDYLNFRNFQNFFSTFISKNANLTCFQFVSLWLIDRSKNFLLKAQKEFFLFFSFVWNVLLEAFRNCGEKLFHQKKERKSSGSYSLFNIFYRKKEFPRKVKHAPTFCSFSLTGLTMNNL